MKGLLTPWIHMNPFSATLGRDAPQVEHSISNHGWLTQEKSGVWVPFPIWGLPKIWITTPNPETVCFYPRYLGLAPNPWTAQLPEDYPFWSMGFLKPIDPIPRSFFKHPHLYGPNGMWFNSRQKRTWFRWTGVWISYGGWDYIQQLRSAGWSQRNAQRCLAPLPVLVQHGRDLFIALLLGSV